MQTEPINILLVDDHAVVRIGLRQVIDGLPGMTVVAEAENGEEALFLCQKHAPDIVLMDVRMLGMGGVAAAGILNRHHPHVRVIGLSTFDDAATIDAMLTAGASGFLSKTASAAELADAIERVHRGETVIGEDCVLPPPSEIGTALGAQQRRVLALLVKGCTNGEIAACLGISLPTARYHVSVILLKLGVSNRAEAVAHAIRAGLVGEGGL